MEQMISICEICKNEARSIEQKRAENWIEINGGSLQGIGIWLEKPRYKSGGFIHSVGYKSRKYHFCSIDCLVKALKAKQSI
jgi:hypothetical protein